MGETKPPPTRLKFVDGLRGVAAAGVVFFHAEAGKHLDQFPEVLRWAFSHGHLGVAVFFALSGFVMAHTLSSKQITTRFFLNFAFRRSVRLDPPYFASIVLVLAMALLSAKVKAEPMVWPSTGQFLSHLLYLQGLLGFENISPVYWTLCLEIQFYLLFCAMLGLAQSLRQRGIAWADGLVFIPLGIVGLLWGSGAVSNPILPGLCITHWHAFFPGVLAYWAWKGRIKTGWLLAYCGPLLVVACFRADLFGVIAQGSALSLWLAAVRQRMTTWLSWKWVQWLGMVSYSLYLTHNTVTGAAFFIWYKLVGRSLGTQALGLVVVVGMCLLGAYAYWWALERPFVMLSKRFKSRAPAATPVPVKVGSSA